MSQPFDPNQPPPPPPPSQQQPPYAGGAPTPYQAAPQVNPYGGAIALGHPVGATGAILTVRAALDLHRRDLEYAVVTMCIGGGQALAALLRRY